METFEEFLASEELSQLKIKYIDFDRYISQDELKIIFQGMDKSDFTSCGVTRWKDLDIIIQSVYSNKKNSPENKLKRVYLSSQCELWPPISYYRYEFE